MEQNGHFQVSSSEFQITSAFVLYNCINFQILSFKRNLNLYKTFLGFNQAVGDFGSNLNAK